MVSTSGTCAHCGGPLLNGSCAACDSQLLYRFIHRELVVLAVLSGIAVLVFFGTRRAAAANQAMRQSNASVWYSQGQQKFAAGAMAEAISAFQRASTADRDNTRYRLALARALSSNQQDDAARQVLLVLRQLQPEDAAVNAQLARLEVRRNDFRAALGYYQSAIYGRWSPERLNERRQLRIELIRYLLTHGLRGRALSELLVLSDELPREVQMQVDAARLYQSAGDPRRARDHFLTGLQIEPENPAAIAGVAQTSFDLGDYARALSYFERLPEPSAAEKTQRDLTQQVLALDPTLARLSATARQQRLQAALRHVIHRLESCGSSVAPAPLTQQALALQARQFGRTITVTAIRESPELIEAVVDRIAKLAANLPAQCSPPTIQDRAIEHIAARLAAAAR